MSTPRDIAQEHELDRPFFRRSFVKGALSALAQAEDFSIFAGSGVSSDAGMPSWNALLDALLRSVPNAEQIEDWDGFAEAAEAVESTLGRASLVEAAYAGRPADFARLVANAMGVQATSSRRPLVDEADGPGQTALAIAHLCVDVREGLEPRYIITTNFDVLLELAILRRARSLKHDDAVVVGPATDDRTSPPSGKRRWKVHHLHGWLPHPVEAAKHLGLPTDVDECVSDSNRLVLSETGYYGRGTGPDWQDRVVESTLGSGARLLIVGTSLADPALVRHLYRTHEASGDDSEPRAYALLLRPTPLPSLTEPEGTARLAYERAAILRWEAVGVRVLYADFAFQIAQFCHELATARSSEFQGAKGRRQFNKTARYGARLDSWFGRAYERDSLISASTKGDDDDLQQASDAFQEAQRRLSAELRVTIAEDLLDRFPSLEKDHLALHLWCRMPQRLTYGRAEDLINENGICSLGMVGASDRSWIEPESVDTRLLHQSGDRVAVKAFTSQAVSFAEAPMATWDQLVAVPVSIQDGKRPVRLPVGVLSLNARGADGERAELTNLLRTPDGLVKLIVYLAVTGRRYLDI
ncbi:MAG: SIR2 family protein [Solirubrobacteraceae bacterium]|nr:SIR2 family protein [Solirubrobacteraceae bacterium]